MFRVQFGGFCARRRSWWLLWRWWIEFSRGFVKWRRGGRLHGFTEIGVCWKHNCRCYRFRWGWPGWDGRLIVTDFQNGVNVVKAFFSIFALGTTTNFQFQLSTQHTTNSFAILAFRCIWTSTIMTTWLKKKSGRDSHFELNNSLAENGTFNRRGSYLTQNHTKQDKNHWISTRSTAALVQRCMMDRIEDHRNRRYSETIKKRKNLNGTHYFHWNLFSLLSFKHFFLLALAISTHRQRSSHTNDQFSTTLSFADAGPLIDDSSVPFTPCECHVLLPPTFSMRTAACALDAIKQTNRIARDATFCAK